MRELTFVETGYLSILLLISLVLSLAAARGAAKDPSLDRWHMKITLMGQMILGLAGLFVLLSSKFSAFAFTLGAANCIFCLILLGRGNVSHTQRSGRRCESGIK